AELIAVEEDARRCLCEELHELADMASPVERDEDSAELCAGKEGVEGLDAVHGEHPDAISPPDLRRVAQEGGEPVCAPVHLPVREPTALALVDVDHGERLRVVALAPLHP